jgi:hypothetical protein
VIYLRGSGIFRTKIIQRLAAWPLSASRRPPGLVIHVIPAIPAYPVSPDCIAKLFEILRICELPHIGTAQKYANPYRQAQRDAEGMQMRAGMVVGIVVAIGLIWSVAAMSNLVPVVDGSVSVAISRPAE